MKIAGIQKNSFVDYPDKLSAVIFTLGCNMNCFYCHNREIIIENNQDLISPDYFLEFLKKRKAFLEGVVITGGEPTLQHDLIKFVKDVKYLGFSVKLDTNGTNPCVLEDILNQGLIDYIAMDVKAPIEKYEEICGLKNINEKILESIKLIMDSKIEYEFRTTLIPQLELKDLKKIVKIIKGAQRYVIQQYRIPQNNENFEDERLKEKPIDKKIIIEYGEEIKKYFKQFQIRGV